MRKKKKMDRFGCTSLESFNNIWFACLPFSYAKITTVGKLIAKPILQKAKQIAAKVKPSDI